MPKMSITDIILDATGTKRRGASLRKMGNRAMRARNWTAAIECYSQHLADYPDDFPISVQFGHALKEAGDYKRALATYQALLPVHAGDADLQLSIGRLLKLMGRWKEAEAACRASAAIDGNVHALNEIAAIEEAAARARDHEAERSLLEAVALIAGSSENLEPLTAGNIQLDEETHHLHLTSNDPWIEFSLARKVASAAPLAKLVITTAPVQSNRALSGQVFLDYGAGYTERGSLRFQSDHGPVTLLIAHPAKVKRLRWDPDSKPNVIALPRLSLAPVAAFDEAEALIRAACASNPDVDDLVAKALGVFEGDAMTPAEAAEATAAWRRTGGDVDFHYGAWLKRHETPTASDYAIIAEMTAAMPIKPSFSFVMPVYNTPIPLLRECIESMLAQTYDDFEICIADDCSPDPRIARELARFAARDKRIKYVRCETNGHISAASNRALELATGEFVVLVDHDDLIPDFALFVVAHYINLHPNADILYSDEDKIGLDGERTDPYFKGGWNRYLMFGHNMVSHLGVYRRALMERVGGFRLGLEGSQDYDLMLRCYEQSSDDRIIHIPHVLYHWRMIPGSTSVDPSQKSYAIVAAQAAINGHFERMGMPLFSSEGCYGGLSGMKPTRALDTPVSIIIPTRNGLDVLKPCVESVRATGPRNVELLIVDNGSDDSKTLAYMDRLEKQGIARILRYDHPFNFSAINNFAAEQATGEILCFLNNDTEVIAKDWLVRARALLSIPGNGIIGARLLYPDNTLQHFGIVLGMGAHGIAGTPHGGFPADDPGNLGKARLTQEFSAVTAACLFIRKADFDRVGGFETELAVAYNDIDLCLKIRAAGLKVLADPDILLTHKESRTRGSDSTGARAERLLAEMAWMKQRWGDALANDPYYSPNLSLERDDFVLAAVPRVPIPWRQHRHG